MTQQILLTLAVIEILVIAASIVMSELDTGPTALRHYFRRWAGRAFIVLGVTVTALAIAAIWGL